MRRGGGRVCVGEEGEVHRGGRGARRGGGRGV